MSRIAVNPRRAPLADADALIGPVSNWLRTPTGTQILRPIQACALVELPECRGLFCGARVGAGKTLISGLAPAVLGSRRPLLIVPAKHCKRTALNPSKVERELAEYRLHWQIPRHIRIESYSRLGLSPTKKRPIAPYEEILWGYRPDLIVLDEAHHLKRVKSAACARRVARYLHEFPDCHVVVLTGTMTRTSIQDYAHMLIWALRQQAPVPIDPDILEEWAFLIDEPEAHKSACRDNSWRRADYSVLVPHLGHVHDRETAREAFRSRLLETKGVLISQDAFDLPLTIRPIRLETPDYLEPHWFNLREHWITPDEWLLPDKQIGVWNVAQQLALGFYYRHDPRPPTDWLEARREWCGFCRRVLESTDLFDTELQIREACITGRLPTAVWERWAAIKDSFVPNTVPTWLSTHALQRAAAWGEGGGIVWATHKAFAQALAAITGWPFHHHHGLDANKVQIDQTKARTVIASVKACGDGFNLQYQFHRNLFVTPPKSSVDWEQRVGRTHRDGQPEVEVTVDYFVGCLENFVALPCAVGYAEYTQSTMSQPQKILQADRQDPPLEWAVGQAY